MIRNVLEQLKFTKAEHDTLQAALALLAKDTAE